MQHGLAGAPARERPRRCPARRRHQHPRRCARPGRLGCRSRDRGAPRALPRRLRWVITSPSGSAPWSAVAPARSSPRPRVRPLGAASGADPCQLGHRPRRAARVPDPRRHQATSRCPSPVRWSPATIRRSSAPRSTSWSASTGAHPAGRTRRVGHRLPRRTGGRSRSSSTPSSPSTPSTGAPAASATWPTATTTWRDQLTWLTQLDSYGGRELPRRPPAGRLARDHRPADQPSALCHGDYKLDNVLFAPESPTRAAGRGRLGDGGHRRSARRPGLGAHLPPGTRGHHAPRHGQGAEVRRGPPPRPPDAGRALRGRLGPRHVTRSAGTTCSPGGSWPSSSKAATPSSCGACRTSRSTSSSATRSTCCWPAPPTIIDRGEAT